MSKPVYFPTVIVDDVQQETIGVAEALNALMNACASLQDIAVEDDSEQVEDFQERDLAGTIAKAALVVASHYRIAHFKEDHA